MTRTVIFQLVFFLLPFIAYGAFRFATRNVRDWKKSWPLQVLFMLGLASGILGWIVLILLQPPKEREVCVEPPRFENGVLIPAREYACEKNVAASGQPRTDPNLGGATPAPEGGSE